MNKTPYELGHDCGLNGPHDTNCHFSIFSTPENTQKWESGKRDAENLNKSTMTTPTNPKVAEIVEELKPILDMATKYQSDNGYPCDPKENELILTHTLTTLIAEVEEGEREKCKLQTHSKKVQKRRAINNKNDVGG